MGDICIKIYIIMNGRDYIIYIYIYCEKRGPRMDPCGTPLQNLTALDLDSLELDFFLRDHLMDLLSNPKMDPKIVVVSIIKVFR